MRRSGTGTFSTTLATIRYAQPKPFFTYATRAQKTGAPRPRIDGKGRAFRLEMHFRLPRAADTVGSRLRRPTILS